MLEAKFQFDPLAAPLIVEILLDLPPALRPTHQSASEDEQGTPITDRVRLIERARRGYGSFFRKNDAFYDLSIAGQMPVELYCRFTDNTPLICDFLVSLGRLRPLFAFACAPEERLHWNRVVASFGINVMEAWVGRDLEKYIPGLYWYTLLPASLMARHGVSLSALEDVALEHIALDHDQHLFRFYDDPTDWATADRVAALRASSPGIFDVKLVAASLPGAKTFLELEALLAPWP